MSTNDDLRKTLMDMGFTSEMLDQAIIIDAATHGLPDSNEEAANRIADIASHRAQDYTEKYLGMPREEMLTLAELSKATGKSMDELLMSTIVAGIMLYNGYNVLTEQPFELNED